MSKEAALEQRKEKAESKEAIETVKVKLKQSMGGDFWDGRPGQVMDWRADEVADLVEIGAVEIIESDEEELAKKAKLLDVGLVCHENSKVAAAARKYNVPVVPRKGPSAK